MYVSTCTQRGEFLGVGPIFGSYVRLEMYKTYKHAHRPITPLLQGQYDIHMVNVALKTLLDKDEIKVGDLPKVNPLKLPQIMHEIAEAINQIPPVPEYYSERKENQ